MGKTDLFLEDFDPETLSGQAKVTIDKSSSTNNELEAIRQACKKQSELMPDNYKMEYDGQEIKTQRSIDDSGQSVTDIIFGVEVKNGE